MTDLAKIIIIIGSITVLMGVVLLFVGKIPGVGKLPGDIFIKKDSFSFYFPITTSIIVSIVLSLFFYFFGKR
jgi:hypothetical protein